MCVCVWVGGWACVCASSVSDSFVRGEERHRCVYVSATRTTQSARLAVVVPFPSGLLACVAACCLLCKEGEGGKAFRALAWGELARIDIADVAPLLTRICEAPSKQR